MSEAARLIAAMHGAGGAKIGRPIIWHALAQRDDALRAAVAAVFGKRFPTTAKLGQWLSEHIGRHGDYLLEGKHSTKRKAWLYRVTPTDEVAEQERRRKEAEAQLEARLEAQAPPKLANVQVAAPTAPRPAQVEYETSARVASDGRLIREPIVDPRTGLPLEKRPEPSAATPKPEEPAKPRTRVEEMRARYLAHHTGVRSEAEGGAFSDPGGIVSFNIMNEQRAGGGYCHVTGKWPG